MLERVLPLTRPMIDTLRQRPMDVAVGLYAAICFAYVTSGEELRVWISLLVPFFGLAAITTQSRTVRFGSVLGLTATMLALVLANYFTIANHGFMLVWTGLALALACACEPPRDEEVLQRNAALLLAILMAMALIQKLRTPYYMDGDLLGDLILQGDIFRNLIGLVIPDWPTLLQDYKAAAQGLLAVPEAQAVAIAVPPAVAALAWRMTVASLVAQAVLEVLILFRARVGMLLHLAILGFVFLVYLTRNENIFLSINCLLGYAMTNERTAAARPWYVVAAVYLLSADMIGLRPWIIS